VNLKKLVRVRVADFKTDFPLKSFAVALKQCINKASHCLATTMGAIYFEREKAENCKTEWRATNGSGSASTGRRVS
jgi:hypothetical protein